MQQVDIHVYSSDRFFNIVPADGQLAIYGGCEAVHVSLSGADRGALRYMSHLPPSPPSPTSHWHPPPGLHTHTEEQLSAVDSLISSMDLMTADM